MSVDFAGKSGVAYNTVPVAALAGITAATFTGGNAATASKFQLTVTTAGGAVNAGTLPTTMLVGGAEAFVEGTVITLIKATSDTNNITFADPVLGITFSYVDRQGESITLVLDGNAGTPRWIAAM